MRPPSHIPLPARMMAPESILLIARDWFAVRESWNRGNRPAPPPLLFVTHGNVSHIENEIDHYRPVSAWGWLLAMPQSSQPSLRLRRAISSASIV